MNPPFKSTFLFFPFPIFPIACSLHSLNYYYLVYYYLISLIFKEIQLLFVSKYPSIPKSLLDSIFYYDFYLITLTIGDLSFCGDLSSEAS